MPRPIKKRRVGFLPPVSFFKPAGVPLSELEEVCLGVEELEALRLKDFLGMDQEECAARMNLAQSSFQRLLAGARMKVAEALVKGLAIRIEGGHYELAAAHTCMRCGYGWEDVLPDVEEGVMSDESMPKGQECPSCGGTQVQSGWLWHGRAGGPPALRGRRVEDVFPPHGGRGGRGRGWRGGRGIQE